MLGLSIKKYTYTQISYTKIIFVQEKIYDVCIIYVCVLCFARARVCVTWENFKFLLQNIFNINFCFLKYEIIYIIRYENQDSFALKDKFTWLR